MLDTPVESTGGGSVTSVVVVIATTVFWTEVVPNEETVDVSVTGTVVVTIVNEDVGTVIEDPGRLVGVNTVDGDTTAVDKVHTVVNVDVPKRPTDVEVAVTVVDPVQNYKLRVRKRVYNHRKIRKMRGVPARELVKAL